MFALDTVKNRNHNEVPLKISEDLNMENKTFIWLQHEVVVSL